MNIENLSVTELIDIGLDEYKNGNIHAAYACYDAALGREPDNFDALHLMGLLASSVGDFEAAKSLISSALRANPLFVDAYINLGNVLVKMGENGSAVSCYYRALGIDPTNLKACSNLAAVLNHLGRLDEAEEMLTLGLALDPNSWEMHHNLADTHRLAKRYEQAIKQYEKAIEINPNYADSHFHLGNVLCEIESYEEAMEAYEKAIALSPNEADYHKNLGSCLNHLHRTDEAIAALIKALELDDQNPSNCLNLGLAYRENNDVENAKRYYEKTLSLKPSHPEAKYSLATAKLLNGEFEDGWKLFEERFNPAKAEHIELPSLGIPMWQGESLEGKSIILWGEQGLGDHMQFGRYAQELKEKAKKVAFVTRIELKGVFESAEIFNNIDIVYTLGEMIVEEYDFFVPAISAGIHLGINKQNAPAKDKYLQADTAKSASFSKIFECHENALKVGIVWQGSRHIPRADKLRSLSLKSFEPLANIEGVQLFSLQIGHGHEQLEECGFKDRLIDLATNIHEMSDTLALIEHLDLVISVDTSVAHLSAASGKPTWILLQFANCWRWGLDTDRSYWYDSVRLFRQHKKGDWNQALASVEKGIIELKKARNR